MQTIDNQEYDGLYKEALRHVTSSQKEEANKAYKDIKKMKIVFFAVSCFSLCLAGVVCYLLLNFASVPIWAGLLFGLFVFIFGYALSLNAYRKKARNAADNIIAPQISKIMFGADCYYNPKEGYSQEDMAGLGLFEMGNRFESTNYSKGSYNGVPLTLARVISSYHSSGKNGGTTYFFQGVVGIYQLHKTYKGTTEIREREVLSNHSLAFRKDSLVPSSDDEFNKQFNVYSTSKEAAEELLSPYFIKAFKQIKALVPGSLIFQIQSDRLVVAIEGFEQNLAKVASARSGEELIGKVIMNYLPFQWFADLLVLDANGNKQ